MQRLPRWASQTPGELYPINEVINVAYLVTPFRRGGPVEKLLQWKVTRRWPRQRKWLMVPHQWKWPLMETKNMAQAA